MNNGTGAAISLSAGGVAGNDFTSHYYGSTGFTLSKDITFTMPSSSVTIITTAVVHNSTTMYSSTAGLYVVSVNGVANSNSGSVCGGNSGGWW